MKLLRARSGEIRGGRFHEEIMIFGGADPYTAGLLTGVMGSCAAIGLAFLGAWLVFRD